MLVVFLNVVWLLLSAFLILVILVQRGRGGGLAGALGGIGGSSAFGTRAGDVFTKITVGVFFGWLLVGVALIPLMARAPIYTGGADASNQAVLVTGEEGTAPAEGPAAAKATPADAQAAAKATPASETSKDSAEEKAPPPAKSE